MDPSNRRPFSVAAMVAFLAAGCTEPARDDAPGGTGVTAPRTPSQRLTPPAALRSSAQASAARAADPMPAPLEAVVDAGVQGGSGSGPRTIWQRCATGFRPRATPEVDVLRLGMLCGPSHGMLRWGPVLRGRVGEDGSEGRHRVRVDAGACVRFAIVAAEGVEDLEIELGATAPGAEPVIRDERWALLPEDGPLCVSKATTVAFTVRTHAGGGPYVIAGWRRR
jgi:hypothetical protein